MSCKKTTNCIIVNFFDFKNEKRPKVKESSVFCCLPDVSKQHI